MLKKSLLMLFLAITTAASASWQAPITNYAPRVYHGGTQNWKVAQHPNGWMYFGNNYGLLEYDGESWNLYGIWSSSVIRSIDIHEDGRIFVGGTNEYGMFTANQRGGLDYKPLSQHIPDMYKEFGEAWNIMLLGGNIYVQTHNHIFIQSEDDENDFSVVEPKSHIYCSAKIRNGIYIGTSDGIYLLNGNELNALRGSELLKGKAIRRFQPYGTSSVLIATDYSGLYIFNGEEILPFETEADDFIRSNELFSFAVSEKYIAIGSVRNGLVVMNNEGKQCRYINNLNGLQDNTVLSLDFDRFGSLWLGLDQGIDRVFLDSPVEILYGNINTRGAGYACIIDNGTIYLGTNQGLFYDTYPFDKSQRLTDLKMVKESTGQVWCLDRVGDDIFCSHNRGLFIVKNRDMKPVTKVDGFWTVRGFPDNPNEALGGSYAGLYLLRKENGTWRVVRKIRGFDTTARQFEINSDGVVWMITTNGVETLVLNDDRSACTRSVAVAANGTSNDYFSIAKLNGTIVVSGNGHCHTVSEVGRLSRNEIFFNKMDGDKLYSFMCSDADGNIWYISDDAVRMCPYDKKSGTYRNSVEIWNKPGFLIGGFAYILPVGGNQAIVTSIYGFAMADMTAAVNRVNSYEDATYIRRVYAKGSRDSLVYGDSYVHGKSTISVPYGSNSLRFESTGCVDTDEPLSFCYMLEPLETEYSGWSVSNVRDYTSLREGKYVFHVRSRGSSLGAESEAVLEFRVLPPWYRSWWFYLIEILLLALVLYLVYLFVRNRMEKSRMMLSMQKDEEMREKEKEFMEQAHQREKKILQLQNEQVELELKSKSQELANITLNRLNKNEVLQDVKDELKKLQEDIKTKNFENANRKVAMLQGKLSDSMETDVDWKQFEENFDIVHAHFLQKLTEKYPWLGKKERRLCIYIRMGLLTKEIAPLMNMSTRGVEMIRYRMRKRMELDRGEDLEDYFQTKFNDED